MSDWFDLFGSDNVRRLSAVTLAVHHDLPRAVSSVHFNFDEFEVRIAVNHLDDTLEWRRTDATSRLQASESELGTIGFLADYVGRVLRYAWVMESDRGCQDGILLLFGDEPGDLSSHRLLLYAVASQVSVIELKSEREISISAWPFD